MRHFLSNPNELLRELHALSPAQCAAFAAIAAERMVPVYERFCEEFKTGDPQVLHNALDAVWRHVIGEKIGKEQINVITDSIGEVVPDLDDVASDSDYLYACGAVVDAVEACLEEKGNAVQKAGAAAQAAYVAIADYGAPNSSEKGVRERQPAVSDEIALHDRLLSELRGTQVQSADAARSLRQRYVVDAK